MCLAVPGQVVEIYEDGPLKMAKVDFGGVTKEACIAWIPEVEVGQYVIVHAGFAINTVDEEDAKETLRLLAEMGEEKGSMIAWGHDAGV